MIVKTQRIHEGCEDSPKRESRLCGEVIESNRLIDAKISFYGTYVILNEQVTLQNQDPKKLC